MAIPAASSGVCGMIDSKDTGIYQHLSILFLPFDWAYCSIITKIPQQLTTSCSHYIWKSFHSLSIVNDEVMGLWKFPLMSLC